MTFVAAAEELEARQFMRACLLPYLADDRSAFDPPVFHDFCFTLPTRSFDSRTFSQIAVAEQIELPKAVLTRAFEMAVLARSKLASYEKTPFRSSLSAVATASRQTCRFSTSVGCSRSSARVCDRHQTVACREFVTRSESRWHFRQRQR